MDKYMNNAWFMRIVAFALAALLFISVNFEMETDKKSLGLSTAPEMSTETIENVPVEVYYDRENLVVSGVPETVDVTLKGAKSLLINAKSQRDFKVYVDLSDPEITMGNRTVSFKISDLNEKIVATVDPEYANVNVQERVTKDFSVEAEYNSSLLEEGYTAGQPKVSPETVKITGAKDVIEKISYVKATLEIDKGLNESVNDNATVKALDRDLNKLDVTIEPASVLVSLDVSIPSKKVSIIPKQSGKAKDGVKIKSVSVNPKEVTLYGRESVLEKIDQLSLPVNISKVTGDTEIELDLTKPDDVQKMSAGTAKVKISTEKTNDKGTDESKDSGENSTDTENNDSDSVDATPNEEELSDDEPDDQEAIESPSDETKTFNNLKIEPAGVQDGQEVTIDPGTANITLQGNADKLKNVSKSDIGLTVDVSQLNEGQHDVEVSVNAPSGVKWNLSTAKVTVSVSISAKEEGT